MNLFENLYEEKKPLAFRYRPKTLEDFYGQEKLVGEKGVLKRIIEKGRDKDLDLFVNNTTTNTLMQ